MILNKNIIYFKYLKEIYYLSLLNLIIFIIILSKYSLKILEFNYNISIKCKEKNKK